MIETQSKFTWNFRLLWIVSVVCLLFYSVHASARERYPIGSYIYDGLDRYDRSQYQDGDRPGCPDVQRVEYAGSILEIKPPARVSPSFVPMIKDFERVVKEEALLLFGSKDVIIRQIGSYTCRAIKGARNNKLSEHAFANALDVSAFNVTLPNGKRVTISFRKDWYHKDRKGYFLYRIVYRLIDEHIFRIILGPGASDHRNVLHVDYGRSWYDVIDFPSFFSMKDAVADLPSLDSDASDTPSTKKSPPSLLSIRRLNRGTHKKTTHKKTKKSSKKTTKKKKHVSKRSSKKKHASKHVSKKGNKKSSSSKHKVVKKEKK